MVRDDSGNDKPREAFVRHRLRQTHIERACRVVDPVFLDSPQFVAEALEPVLGCRLVVKVETLNPIRSFKGRGASYLVHDVPPGSPLVCASAGNFGQAMAYACRSHGVRLIVYASTAANPLKIERMRVLGAEVRLRGADFDAAKLAAREAAAESGQRFVEDSREAETGEGAATIGVELTRWPDPLDAVLLPLGNGALLAGVGRWLRAWAPSTQVVGVAAEGSLAMADSWRAGRLVQHERIDTIADGIGVRIPVPEAVADLAGVVDDIVLVSDAAMLAAMRLLHEHIGLVVEPSGAAGVAALLLDRKRWAGRLVATVLTGGNVTPQQMRDWLG